MAFRGWSVRSVNIAGHEAIGRPIDLGVQDVSDVTLFATKTPSGITGTVRDVKGNAVPRASVYVIPDDRSLWLEYGPLLSTWLRSVRADPHGTFSLRSLPAADFVVVAVTGAVTQNWTEPNNLRLLVSNGKSTCLVGALEASWLRSCTGFSPRRLSTSAPSLSSSRVTRGARKRDACSGSRRTPMEESPYWPFLHHPSRDPGHGVASPRWNSRP
jgi:hypothetical protein